MNRLNRLLAKTAFAEIKIEPIIDEEERIRRHVDTMSPEEVQTIIETTDNYNGYLLSYFSHMHLVEILKKKMEQQKQPIVIIRYMQTDGSIETKIDILNEKMLSDIEKNYLNVRELEESPSGSDVIFTYELSHAISIQIKEASNFSGLKERKMLEENREAS